MANHHGTAALLIIASLLVAAALADARVTLDSNELGGYEKKNVPVVTTATSPSAPVKPTPTPSVPVLDCSKVHGVQAGETCFSVGQDAGLTLQQFLAFNPNVNCRRLFIGQWVCIAAAFSSP